MRKVIIAILSLIAISTIILPEGEYGSVIITSCAANEQFSSDGKKANNIGIPFDEIIEAPETAPVSTTFDEIVDAPETAPNETIFVFLNTAPETAPVLITEKETTSTSTSTFMEEMTTTAEETTTTTKETTTTVATKETTSITSMEATTSIITTTTTILVDINCPDGTKVKISEDLNGNAEIEASGEKDLLKEIFDFIKNLFS